METWTFPCFCRYTRASEVVHFQEVSSTANAVIRDIVHRFYQGVFYFKSVMSSRYTFKCNFILPMTNGRPSPVRFSRKLQVIRSVMCRSLTPILYPNRTVTVESTNVDQFTP